MSVSGTCCDQSHIYILSDSLALAQGHLQGLEGLGQGVSVIDWAHWGQGHVDTHPDDVIIVHLDDVRADVLAHVRAIRGRCTQVGIVCLVGQAHAAMRVAAAQAGADHCLDRASSQVLLRAVVQALMRRL